MGTVSNYAFKTVRKINSSVWRNCSLSPFSGQSLLHNADSFDVGELANTLTAEFPSEAGAFDAAKWQARVRCHHLVDEDEARLKFIDETRLFFGTVGPCAC